MAKKALITGITGQDGSYLRSCCSPRAMKFTEWYAGTSTLTRTSASITFFCRTVEKDGVPFLHYGDLTDAVSINRLLREDCAR